MSFVLVEAKRVTGRITVCLGQLLVHCLYKGLKLADLYSELFQLYMYLVSSAFALCFIMLPVPVQLIIVVLEIRFILENTNGLH